MKIINAKDALGITKGNNYKAWNKSSSSSLLSEHPNDASRRIHDGFAEVIPKYSGLKLTTDAPVFAMGSCFAREIESALIRKGGNVVSLDESIQRPEFYDGEGNVRSGFFHRFTPRSIWQEFMWCFDELDSWKHDSLIWGSGESERNDLNYWKVPGCDRSLEAIMTRRAVARNLVRNAVKADVIILTLGLIEAWYHKPSNLYANYGDPTLLARYSSEFELHLLDIQDTLTCLEEIYRLLHKKHQTGKFRLVITVSPVPLQSTFTGLDIIIANTASKAVLRAAAAEFVEKYDDVDYFPSFEIVNNSAHSLAWRPDRLHVNPEMVRHIVDTFYRTYFQTL